MMPVSSNNLNSFLFSTPEMSKVFSAEAQLRAMMRFEWALTDALESCNLAQTGSASVLESLLPAEFIDIDSLTREAKLDGNIAIPFVRQLTAAVKARNQSASFAIHLGATSQDLLDSAQILQMREALKLIEDQIKRFAGAVARQVKAHQRTIMMGRTWLQAGPPVTFGLKLAGTFASMRRHRVRLSSCAERLLVLQFGGAVGTRAALGEHASVVAAGLARNLDLKEPDLPWHTQRDSLAEVVQILGLLTGSLAKFARDISLLMQSEVQEASEGRDGQRGGSSTMPNKRNPVACAAVLATHSTMPGLAATMLYAMPQEHERGLGLWQAEWETVPEAFRRAASALAYSIDIAEHLEVHADRMQENLDAELGLPMAEAVSVAIAQKLGRSRAHEILREATERATKENRELSAILKEMPEVSANLSFDAIQQLLDPIRYLGSSRVLIERLLGEADADEN